MNRKPKKGDIIGNKRAQNIGRMRIIEILDDCDACDHCHGDVLAVEVDGGKRHIVQDSDIDYDTKNY